MVEIVLFFMVVALSFGDVAGGGGRASPICLGDSGFQQSGFVEILFFRHFLA
jgi:hypothetical protein